MARLPALTPDQLDEGQRRVYEAIADGPRGRAHEVTAADGSLLGPFNLLLHSPEIGWRLQHLGEGLRFANSLSGRQLEIAVLVMAAAWKAPFEWHVHARLARRNGVAEPVIAAIGARQPPALGDRSLGIVWQVAWQLAEERRLDAATAAESIAVLGARTHADLVLLLGYYQLISTILTAEAVPAPPGAAIPF